MAKSKTLKTLFIGIILSQFIQTSTMADDATYYSRWYEGHETTSGEIYRGSRMTAAHMRLPLGTIVEVENIKTHKKVIVRINDRGAFSSRNIDLSERAFLSIAKRSQGRIRVKIRVIYKK